MPQAAENLALSDRLNESDHSRRVRHPDAPIWWRGPSKTTGVLPQCELDEMANADCRFLDEE